MVAYATATAFAEAGHEVFVITCAPFEGGKSLAGKWEKVKMQNAECRIFRFTPLNLFTIFNIGKYPPLLRLFWHAIDMFNPHTYLVVKKILAREKPDLIITRNLKGLGYTVPLAIRRYTLHATRYTPRWFHGLHDLGALDPRGFMEWGKESAIRKPMVLIKLYREITKRLFGSPDAIIAPSKFVLDEYNRAGFFAKSKKVVIGNPLIHNPPPPSLAMERSAALYVPPSGGPDAPEQSSVRGRQAPALQNWQSVRARFLYIGQLEPYKGIRVLLEAWKKFIAEYPDARLEIAGMGSLQEEVRGAAERLRGIHYHGFIPHEKLSSLLAGARATILPTLSN